MSDFPEHRYLVFPWSLVMLKGISFALALLALGTVLTSCDGIKPETKPTATPAAAPAVVTPTPPPATPPATPPAVPPTPPPATPPATPPTPPPAVAVTPPPTPAPTPAPQPEVKKETEPVAPPTPPNPASPHPALTNPALASEKAPDKFKAKISTTKGDFTLEITREWAPLGADRFYNMVKIGYFNDVAFFRNVKGFMVQFGIHGDPAVNTAWRSSTLQDDPVVQSNLPGFITYAKTSLPNSRSTQFFINFGNNARLDGMGFAPFGKVVEGMNIVESLFNGYGETPSQAQGAIQSQGNAFLRDNFPNLDYIKSAAIVP